MSVGGEDHGRIGASRVDRVQMPSGLWAQFVSSLGSLSWHLWSSQSLMSMSPRTKADLRPWPWA